MLVFLDHRSGGGPDLQSGFPSDPVVCGFGLMAICGNRAMAAAHRARRAPTEKKGT
jgi:hypothetical protein